MSQLPHDWFDQLKSKFGNITNSEVCGWDRSQPYKWNKGEPIPQKHLVTLLHVLNIEPT